MLDGSYGRKLSRKLQNAHTRNTRTQTQTDTHTHTHAQHAQYAQYAQHTNAQPLPHFVWSPWKSVRPQQKGGSQLEILFNS
eukprot:4420431-Amphidinium_carterae.1